MSLIGVGYRLFYEVAAKGRNYAAWLEKLEKNQTVVHERIVNANDSALSRSRVVHVIGIERWGAHRLRVLLGEPLVMDEYDGYAPSKQLSMVELAEEFRQTRIATINLVRELQSKSIPLSQKVEHNEAGKLTLGAWLFYLDNHMWRETAFLVLGAKNRSEEVTEA